MRHYERTHPWIKFSVDLRQVPFGLWVLLGECQSKCEHLAGIPLQPETAAKFYQVYLAKGVQGTTAIEGNTLSEEQVLQRLQGHLELPPSKKYLEQEIDNIIEACNRIGREIYRQGIRDLTIDRVMDFNRLVLRGLKLEDGVIPGEISPHMVGVGRYRGCPREDCGYLLTRLCDWLNGKDFEPREPLTIGMALIKAILAHLYLAWIHPFGDGNGRTARLVEFHILFASGVPGPAAHLLSNFYNQTRTEYYRQLDYASKSGGDVIPFLTYAIQGFRDGLREQIQRIRYDQWEAIWINHVHTVLPGDRESHRRQRRLVLDLASCRAPVPLPDLRMISARIATDYAKRTEKTLIRDINALMKLDLVKREGKGYIANRGHILAWLPIAVQLEQHDKTAKHTS